MKTLVCEMCGGNNLLKDEGIFVCQNCRTKYSIEEAKRMMIEGPVDVSGSTVKVDNTDKLDNLYSLARRATDEGNSQQALKYYEQILLEDPNCWEPTFYAAYFSALNILKNDNPGSSVRHSGGSVSISVNYRDGIAPAIRTFKNSLDRVFDLIEKIKDYDEQKEAVSAVDAFVEVFHDGMVSAIENENRRMANEIGNWSQQVEGGTLKSVSLQTNNKNIAKELYQSCHDIVDKFEARKQKLESIVNKRRFDEYWAAHQDEKKALESEKQTLNGKIAKLNDDIKAVPGYTDMVNNQNQIEQERNTVMTSVAKPKSGLLLSGTIAGLIVAIICWATIWGNTGPTFFNIAFFILSVALTFICLITFLKKSKSYKAHKANVNLEYEQKSQVLRSKYARVTSEVEAINKSIAPLTNRVSAIDNELTRPR